MAIPQSLQPRIVTVRKKTLCSNSGGIERVLRARYDFYIHLGEVPSKHEQVKGGTIISVKRIPRAFSEMADKIPAALEGAGWTWFGQIDYDLLHKDSKCCATTAVYHPKDSSESGWDRYFTEVKRLGFYLDSISTSDVAREYAAEKISTTDTPEPARRRQLKHVGLKVEAYFGSSEWSVREYLLAMGRGIMEKVEMARNALVLQ